MSAIVSTDPSSLPALQVIGEEVRVLLASDHSHGIEVFLQHGGEGVGPPPHHHAWDEAYFVLDGTVDVLVDGTVHALRAGAFLFVPAGSVHGYRNTSPRARMLTVTSRPGASTFFRAMDREVSLPPDLATVLSVATGNGVHIALPE